MTDGARPGPQIQAFDWSPLRVHRTFSMRQERTGGGTVFISMQPDRRGRAIWVAGERPKAATMARAQGLVSRLICGERCA